MWKPQRERDAVATPCWRTAAAAAAAAAGTIAAEAGKAAAAVDQEQEMGAVRPLFAAVKSFDFAPRHLEECPHAAAETATNVVARRPCDDCRRAAAATTVSNKNYGSKNAEYTLGRMQQQRSQCMKAE